MTANNESGPGGKEPPATNRQPRSSVATEHRPPTNEHRAADEVSLLDLLVEVATNLRLLVLGSLAAGLVALVVAFLIPPTFTARTSFLPPQQQQSTAMAALSQLGALAGVASSAAGLKNPADQYVALLKSTTVADRLIDRFNLKALYAVEFRQEARKVLDRRTQVTAGKNGLIEVEVRDEVPGRAAEMANAYVSELGVLLGRLALTEAQQRRVFFEQQLTNTKIKLTEAERALNTTGVPTSALKANPDAAVVAVARLKAQVTALEIRLAAMRGYMSDTAPELAQAQTELAAVRSQLKKEQANEPPSASSGDYIEKYRDFKYQETLFELFARQFELAKADESREGAVIQVVDIALPPERKSHPKKGLIAILTTVAAGTLLLIWVFIRESIRNSAARPDDAGKLAAIRAGFARLLTLRPGQR